jgi:alpha,alpha-trehalose phosphorylase
VISPEQFPVEPWCVRQIGLDRALLAHTESLFALSNGHIGLRGNLDEGEPNGLPGTYLNGFFETRPLPYAEAGYGYPEDGQSIVNVTNGKIIRLLVDDEPFDVRYGEVISEERCLDLRAGTLTRTTDWRSPAGSRVIVRSTRLVSLQQRAVAAIRWSVQTVGGPARIIVQCELVANEQMPSLSDDPRVAAALSSPLHSEESWCRELAALLIHRTKLSGLRMAAAMEHHVSCDVPVDVTGEHHPDWARSTLVVDLQEGQCLDVVKLLAYGWSAERTLPAVRDQVEGALAGARSAGWDGLVAEQRQVLDEFWDASDVQIDGDPDLQQAVRFALFQVLQAAARAEQRGVPAKGLTGDGYDGHSFWDGEMFLLPVLSYVRPEAAADVVRWRHHTLPLARERAATLGLRGAAFPWRTIRGEECSAYWPAGSAALHVNADIAVATQRVLDTYPDEIFDRRIALELFVEIARLLVSAGHLEQGVFHLDGLTGPDEYSALADDNLFTNLQSRRALRSAVSAVARHPAQAAELGVSDAEVQQWAWAAKAMAMPVNAELGVHEQSRGFTSHTVWDFAATPPQDYPLLLHKPYLDLYRKQVVKQADLVLALHWCGSEFTFEEKSRNLDYYERLTVRDSSLSACTQAVVCAEVGHLDLAYDYLREAALIDLWDLQHNTKDGLHLASLAGAWLAVVAGFGGLRDEDGGLSFTPQLPPAWSRLAFAVRYRGMRLALEVTEGQTTYTLRDGSAPVSLALHHHGQPVTVTEGTPLVLVNPVVQQLLPRPTQPAGRAPLGARRT